jgi:hypothetical protein
MIMVDTNGRFGFPLVSPVYFLEPTKIWTWKDFIQAFWTCLKIAREHKEANALN